MADTKTALEPVLNLDAVAGSRVLIIDSGVPTARVMREALAQLPVGAGLDCAICINPFDPSLHDMLD